MLPTWLTNRIAAFQKETENSSEGRLSDHLRQSLQRDGSEGGWKPSERTSIYLSIYPSIYLCTRRIFVSLFAMHSATVIAVASKLSTLLPPVPMKIELRLKPLSGGRGEGAGWTSPTSVDTSVGINLCSGTIAKAAESRLSAHLR